MDTSNDGFLDKTELEDSLKSLNPDFSTGQSKSMLGDILIKGERKGDDLIDLYELSAKALQQGLYG